MLILVLAANTSFADFPRLASFHAGDNFMPRQLTKRGHRLVFSNGIIFLAVAGILMLIVTDAKVDRLIPLYAIGVFTSFTLSQAGMAKHHVTHKEQGWRFGLFVNLTGAILSFLVLLIIAVTKFTHGAWVIIVLVPVMVAALVRLNRQYEAEAAELEEDAPRAAAEPVLRRHVVLVLVDELDVAAARALQYARTLTPDELRAVHFDLDPIRTEDLAAAWGRLGLSRVTLEIRELPDRRLNRAVLQLVAGELAPGRHGGVRARPPHPAHSSLAPHPARPHGRLDRGDPDRPAPLQRDDRPLPPPGRRLEAPPRAPPTSAARTTIRQRTGGRAASDRHRRVPHVPGSTPIVEVQARRKAKVTGRVVAVRVQPWGGAATLEATLSDGTGQVTIVFLGRRHVGGVKPGALMTAEGVLGTHGNRVAMLNPIYEFVAQSPDGADH